MSLLATAVVVAVVGIACNDCSKLSPTVVVLHIVVVVVAVVYVVMTCSLALHPWPTDCRRRQTGQKQIVKLFVNFAVHCLFAVEECECVTVWTMYSVDFEACIKALCILNTL